MRNFQKILLIIMLALSVMACGDEANGPETPPVVVDPKSNYGIDTCEYTIVTTCESLDTYEYNESFGFDFGIQLAVKLADSTKASSLDSLIIAADEYTYTFSGQQVKSLYKDSAGAFIINLTYKTLVSQCHEYGNWNIRIYDKVKRKSYSYKVCTDFSNSLIAKPLAYWSHPDTLKFSFDIDMPGAAMNLAISYLDKDSKFISRVERTFSGGEVSVMDAPANASKYTFTIRDEYAGGKRFFAFEKYPNYMPPKLNKNIEFIYGIRKPTQIEYVESLNKYLVLNSADKKLSLYNYGDNSLSWERKYNSEPLMFVYSKENNLIYLELSNKEVLALDPASGNGEKLFSIPASEEAQTIAPTNAGCLVFFKETAKILFYNSSAKTVKISKYTLLYTLENAVYNFYNNRAYARTMQNLYSYNYDSVNDTLLMVIDRAPHTSAGSYLSYSLKLNADGTKLFIGTGWTYACSQGDMEDLVWLGGDLWSFEDLAVISENSTVTSTRSHAHYVPSYTGGIIHGGLYLMNGVLKFTNTNRSLAGQPLEIIIKDGIIAVFSDYNGVLIIEKFLAADLSNYPEA